MPWSAKAQELLRTQYAAVGAAGSASLPRAVAALGAGDGASGGRGAGRSSPRSRPGSAAGSRTSTGSSPPTGSIAGRWSRSTDLKLAPFHLLATEGHVHTDKNHVWHMETLAEVCRADPELLLATRYKVVDVTDPASEEEGIAWWDGADGPGGEGMVVKPLRFILKGSRGLAQPAVKCRGREYLRIIYGPDYTAEENLSRLRHGAWAASGRSPSASSPWASRAWSGSSAASRCAGSTSASSACWPWRASRWTRGCSRPLATSQVHSRHVLGTC